MLAPRLPLHLHLPGRHSHWIAPIATTTTLKVVDYRSHGRNLVDHCHGTFGILECQCVRYKYHLEQFCESLGTDTRHICGTSLHSGLGLEEQAVSGLEF